MPTDEDIEDDIATASEPKKQDEASDRIVRQAKKDLRYGEEWESTARIRFEYDYKFCNADSHNMYQWDDAILSERENRPCLTVNKTQQHNLMIVNDAKQNKPGVRVRPVGDEATYEAAQIFQEIVYHIEYISNAENIYDSAVAWAVQAGIGYWQIVTEPISIDTFDQEIKIKRIKDPRAVFLDPDINEVDGSDARWGIIFEDMAKSVFKETYPEYARVVGNSALAATGQDNWLKENHIRLALYYRKEQKEDKLISFMTDDGEQVLKRLSQMQDDEKQMAKEAGRNKATREHYQYRSRDVLTDHINWYKIAGNWIVDKGEWLGKYVPIVRLPGTETVIDGILDRKGHTRALINAQQIYNYNTPLALNTPLPTPDGWTTMGQVNIGDWLFDENGKPVQVVGMSPVHLHRKCYRVEFDDGSHIIADEDHLWTVECRFRKPSNAGDWESTTKSTKDLNIGKDYIWCTKPFDVEAQKLQIDPYILGAWLGDGSTASNRITCGTADMDDMRANLANRGYQIGEVRTYKNNGSAADITIHGLRADLSSFGLLGNKFIPDQYLRGSLDQRLALLQGLMDTDGHYHEKVNQCIFVNTNKQLINSFCELLRSLGIKPFVSNHAGQAAVYPNGEIYTRQDHYRVVFTANNVPVFKLQRKAEKQTKLRNTHERRAKRFKIIDVIEVPSVPVKCITIASASHLFLAGVGMIPTHNSANVEYGALQTKIPWIVPSAAIGENLPYWSTANTKNHAFLPYEHLDDNGEPIPTPTRPQGPQPGMAYVEGLKIAQNEMMMASGQYQAQFGEAENAKSGVAINARQRQGDRATYHFIDNQAIAIRFTGKIIIDLVPKIYDTQRVMRITGTDGTVMNVTVDPQAQLPYQEAQSQESDQDQRVMDVIFNPNIGMYDVQADTGPSFATKRMEAAAAMTQLASGDKTFMERYPDFLFEMLDFPKANDMAKRAKKFLPPNITDNDPTQDPRVQQVMHQASDHIEKITGELQNTQKALADKTRELEIKEHDLELRFRKEGATQSREDYKAETDRVTALGNAGPGISREQVEPVIRQLIRGMVENGEIGPGITQGGSHIQLPPEPENETGEAAPANGAASGEEEPPVPGARKAPDGAWYVEHAKGQFAKVV